MNVEYFKFKPRKNVLIRIHASNRVQLFRFGIIGTRHGDDSALDISPF